MTDAVSNRCGSCPDASVRNSSGTARGPPQPSQGVGQTARRRVKSSCKPLPPAPADPPSQGSWNRTHCFRGCSSKGNSQEHDEGRPLSSRVEGFQVAGAGLQARPWRVPRTGASNCCCHGQTPRATWTPPLSRAPGPGLPPGPCTQSSAVPRSFASGDSAGPLYATAARLYDPRRLESECHGGRRRVGSSVPRNWSKSLKPGQKDVCLLERWDVVGRSGSSSR